MLEKNINDFIDFFIKNEDDIYKISNWKEEIFNKLYLKLQQVDENLSFEISWINENQKREFIISANWIKKLIPIVEEIYNMLKNSEKFEIIKFRQKLEPPKEMTYNSTTLSAQDLFFELFQWDEWKAELNIYIKNFDNSEDIMNICFLYLDHIIWEYNVMTKIWWIEFFSLTDSKKLLSVYDFSEKFEEFFSHK